MVAGCDPGRAAPLEPGSRRLSLDRAHAFRMFDVCSRPAMASPWASATGCHLLSVQSLSRGYCVLAQCHGRATGRGILTGVALACLAFPTTQLSRAELAQPRRRGWLVDQHSERRNDAL